MATKRIITVIGATGSQGGSVVHTFLSDPVLRKTWTTRAVTRDVTKDRARRLADQGAEVVAADINDRVSLVKAFAGSHTVFAVTDYWTSMDKNVEMQQGKNLADAAKEVGVKHYIWSTLPNVTKMTNGVLANVEHFDSKAAVDDYIQSIGLPASYFLPGFYVTNITGGMLRRTPPGTGPFTLSMPTHADAPVPIFETRVDGGKFVRGMVLGLEDGTFKIGTRVYAATAYYTLQEIVDTFARLFPKDGATAKFKQITPEEHTAAAVRNGSPEHVARELTENMRLLGEFGYYGGASLEESQKLAGPGLTTLEEHMRNAPSWSDLE